MYIKGFLFWRNLNPIGAIEKMLHLRKITRYYAHPEKTLHTLLIVFPLSGRSPKYVMQLDECKVTVLVFANTVCYFFL